MPGLDSFTLPSPSLSSSSFSSTSASTSQVPGQPFRRLLPAGAGAGAATADAEMDAASDTGNPSTGPVTSPITASPPDLPKRWASRKRRQITTAACDPCRKRKTRCDGQRPKCSACVDRGTGCGFDTNLTETHTQALKRKFSELQSRHSDLEDIYEIMRARSDEEATEVFQRIRKGADAATILRHVNYGNILLQLAVVPEARYRYEFPYMSGLPSFLSQRENPYLDSEMYACALRTPSGFNQAQTQTQTQLPTPSPGTRESQSQSPDSTAEQQLTPYWKPYHAAQMIEPLLDAVQPSKWTTVSRDDGLMRRLIHNFLLFESSWMAPFHKDYLLDDMAHEKRRFCTELLVNAVLAVACFYQRDLEKRDEYWNPKNIGYRFLAEARRLFELDSELEGPRMPARDSRGRQRIREWELHRLTVIQAAIMLGMNNNYNGADTIGWRYVVRATEMASEIGLFGHPRGDLDRDVRCVRDYTAWAVYINQGTHQYHCFKPPLIKDPPISPLPDPSRYPDWYGEVWVRYPLGPPRSPTYHGLVIKARADLLSICVEFASVAFKTPGPREPLSVKQILAFYTRLMDWREKLPEPLTPKKIVMPNQLKLHMYYNSILVNVLQPIVMRDWSDGALSDRALALPMLPKSPRDAYLDAKIHFETAIRLYYLRHGFETLDPFVGQFLASLTQLTIDTIKADPRSPNVEEWRSTVLLAAKGIYDYSRSIYVMRAILRLQIGLMLPGDVERLKHFARIDAQNEIHAPLEQPIHSNWSAYAIGYDQKPENLTSLIGNMSMGPANSLVSHTSGAADS